MQDAVERLDEENDEVGPNLTFSQSQVARVCPCTLQEVEDHGHEANDCQGCDTQAEM